MIKAPRQRPNRKPNPRSIDFIKVFLTKEEQNVSKNEKGQYFFTFLENDQIKKDALMFLSSECAVYDNNMRLLRSLLKAS